MVAMASAGLTHADQTIEIQRYVQQLRAQRHAI
jgi:hypothetical protein